VSRLNRIRGSRLRLSLLVALLVAGFAVVAPATAANASTPTTARARATAANAVQQPMFVRVNPDGVVAPTIANQACTPARAQWVHVYPVDTGIFCLGGKGTWVFNNGNGRWVKRLTYGNNYGSLLVNWDGADAFSTFDGGAQGFYHPNIALAWYLEIDGWH